MRMPDCCRRKVRWCGLHVQIAVDRLTQLIVASEVVNDATIPAASQHGQAAKDELGVETLTALADTGYYKGTALKACEEDRIVAYVPQPGGPRGSSARAYQPRIVRLRR